ncbi:serine/threonine-protein kinase par-1-like isoform X1 [Vespa crabro]|uniref:serine/threonine-protein kinase par-1-like isoform X1 n=1 Tax=Vespa crabro TaxID=7445 RepID=UPI001F01FFAD|nr:serine/threonine-protein kinase par-1-like isoform X1 [Vespa crabro]
MIYQSSHQASTMSSTRKTSSRFQHRNLQSSSKCANSKRRGGTAERAHGEERCRGRCRVQWSENHVKEGLVLVQEAQLARVVKTGPITEHYEIDSKPFASGQWARVYRCRSRSTGTVYAAKYSSRNRFNADCSAELRHEIALLSLCSQSPRVVRLHDVYETLKEIIMVMEFAPGGDLQTLIDGDLVPLEGDVVHFVRQLVEGLAYLHERNIAHLDIKPQNLVMMGTFPECDVKLCDFEISRVILEGTEVREILGTPDYVAPEILHYQPITLAADMWSLGVTTYVLLTGFSPFGGDTDQETFQNISLGEVDFPEELFEEVSTQAKDFVAKLLVLDPSARMTAKQCLRHEWLRGAPTQASPHLRRYLSKSREVLLERVVTRDNLRRVALLSQTTSQANLLSTDIHEQNLQDCVLSHSEICLSDCMTASRSSLVGSEGFPSPANSQVSLNSSRTSLSCASQSCLLNKEQTQGLLSRAQSRSQANLNHAASRGLLSRIRSLHRIQSQTCLSNGTSRTTASPVQHMIASMHPVSRSREKLYGLRSLSKSQGVLDIYRSLECLRRKRKPYERAKTEDVVPVIKRIDVEMSRINNNQETTCDTPSINLERQTNGSLLKKPVVSEIVDNSKEKKPVEKHAILLDSRGAEKTYDRSETSKESNSRSEENLDSLKSIESDTLTEESDEMPLDRERELNMSLGKRLCQRQHSDVSSHSNNSGISDDKEDRSTESETEEPKYTVAQLVSAFNKHQEIASKSSLEAIMSEKRINEVTFPTGTKALRLFIPDIDITESTIVRRKTSYKPRKNWEELRKRNEKNEGVLKNFENEFDNDDDEDSQQETLNKIKSEQISNDKTHKSADIVNETCDKKQDNLIFGNWSTDVDFTGSIGIKNSIDTTIDEKYKQCVKVANKSKSEKQKKISAFVKMTSSIRQKERMPNYIYPELTNHAKEEMLETSCNDKIASNINVKIDKKKLTKSAQSSNINVLNVNLEDILLRVDNFQSTPKENMENLRKRTSIAKIIVNDNLTSHENLDSMVNDEKDNRMSFRSPKNELPFNISQIEDRVKLIVPPSFVRSSSLSSDSSCPTPSSVQSDTNVSWEDVITTPGSNISLEKTDNYRNQRKKEIDSNETKSKQNAEDKRLWGKVCTGSYTRAMERFTGKNDCNKKSMNLLSTNIEKIRRKSTPTMPQCVNP